MITISILSVLGIVVLFLGFTGRTSLIVSATALTLVAGIGSACYELFNIKYLETSLYASPFINKMLFMDLPASFFTLILVTSALLMLPFAKQYIHKAHAQPAEYFALMIFALAGAIMMVSFSNLLMLFIGIEVLSISIYVLTGSDKRNLRGNEAALKYFLMGAFATGIFLFGVALVYAETGTFYIFQQEDATASPFMDGQNLRLLGLAFMLFGLLFKISAAPFHFWTPDVYEGAPTFFTMFMSTIVKTAGFAAIMRLLQISYSDVQPFWYNILAVSAVLTLIVGNVMALIQQSFKRMMAFSSISHAGYMLVAVLAMADYSIISILFYSLAYALATVVSFGVLTIISETKHGETMEVLKGLGKNQPLLAAALTISMCSLAGIPLTAGFVGKFYIITSALQGSQVWLLAVVVVASAISMYYYFKVIATMYMGEKTADVAIVVSFGQRLVLILICGLILLLGLYPDILKLWMPANLTT